jgi:matrix metalloproteinase-14 (membrane-inserted)
MAPFYRGWKPDLRLAQDDIDAIQTLYGVNSKDADEPRLPPSPTSSEDTPSSPPSGSGSDSGGDGNAELCEDPTFDAIFGTGDGSYYVFKGSKYWKLTEDSVESGYPRPISQDWPGLPDDIDAAVMWSENKKT